MHASPCYLNVAKPSLKAVRQGFKQTGKGTVKKVSFSATIYKPKGMHVIQAHIRNAFIYQIVDKNGNKRRKKESTSPKRTTAQGNFFKKHIYLVGLLLKKKIC